MPLISVVIPVHNGARFLSGAVASVLGQKYPPLEIIVVDDGSTDHLELAIENLPVEVKRIRQPQRGPAAARNIGITLASGEFLAFLDVDDLWPPGMLAELLGCMVDPECEVAAGWAQMAVYDEADGVTTPFGIPEESFPHHIGAGLYRRSVFEAVGLFDPRMRYAEDIDWFARFRESGRTVRRLPLPTLIRRRHGTNMTNGRDVVGLGVVRAVKKSLDRRRLRDDDVMAEPDDVMPSERDFNRRNIEEFRANGGKVGGQFEGFPLLLLTSTGARSGEQRTNLMAYFDIDDKIYVIGSAAGRDRDPAWAFNLRAHPAVTVEIGTNARRGVTAHELPRLERDRIYGIVVERAPGFGDYATRTERVIPVFELTPDPPRVAGEPTEPPCSRVNPPTRPTVPTPVRWAVGSAQAREQDTSP
jgi:deazaflavin-dependent oxidoreductase (nitroreductase family)